MVQEGATLTVNGVSLMGIWPLACALAPCVSNFHRLVVAPILQTLTIIDTIPRDSEMPSASSVSAATWAVLSFLGGILGRPR